MTKYLRTLTQNMKLKKQCKDDMINLDLLKRVTKRELKQDCELTQLRYAVHMAQQQNAQLQAALALQSAQVQAALKIAQQQHTELKAGLQMFEQQAGASARSLFLKQCAAC